MSSILVLTEHDLRQVVGLGTEELETIEAVYPLISSGSASMPPIMRIDVPEHNGEIDIKSAYLPGFSGIAIKVSAGFFDNPQLGLPSLGGLMMVLSSETGVPESALFDNGYLTDLRTALAGAVAAKHLSRPDASIAAVFGAGVQARFQMEALSRVRSIEEIRVWARRPDQAERLVHDLEKRVGIKAKMSESRESAMDGADIAVTTTPTTEPLLTIDMIRPGVHVTAVGSDAESKQELSAEVVRSADRFVCDSVAQSQRLGELRSATAAGYDPESAVELGQIVSGAAVGRSSRGDVTICDLTGTGAQDTAIASLAVKRCQEAGVGIEIET